MNVRDWERKDCPKQSSGFLNKTRGLVASRFISFLNFWTDSVWDTVTHEKFIPYTLQDIQIMFFV